MTMLTELIAELIGMFVGERRLTIAVLTVVAVTAALIDLTGLHPLVAGAVLLFGSLALLLESVCRAARERAR